jgi:translation initiation factor 3 subunit K
MERYQFNPQLSNPEIIINILTQALSSTVHGPDFNLCLSLLREPSVRDSLVKKKETDRQAILADTDGDEGDGGLELVMPWLQNLHHLTRSCQFTSFWKEFNSNSDAAQR